MFPEFDLDRPGPPSGGPLSKEQQALLDEMLRRTLDPEEHRRLERLLLQRLRERQPELTGMLQEEGFVTGFQENEGHRFGVAGQRSRQRLECACLQHRFPFAATRQALSQARRCPAAKAPVKPDALQTLARAIDRFPNRPVRLHPFTPEFREAPELSGHWTHEDHFYRCYHARFMLEMAVCYADLPGTPHPLPNGWAALLYLFDLR